MSAALWELPVTGLRSILESGETDALAITESILSRIETCEPSTRAWAFLDADLARISAQQCNASGALGGVPFGIKDIFNTMEMPTAMGSEIWSGFTPGNDARVVHAAKLCGAVPIGKTVTAEFAVHTPGDTANPWDPTRTPGTSSSGSAVAVACGMVPWALGSQTAGSIIRPATYAGIYGYKPSYGLLPRTGMLKTTDTLDQIGFFARSPFDLHVILDCLRVKGRDYPLVHQSMDVEPDARTGQTFRVAFLSDLAVEEGLSRRMKRTLDEFKQALPSDIDVSDVRVDPLLNEAHTVHATIYERCLSYYFRNELIEHRTRISPALLEMVERGLNIDLEVYAYALDRQLEQQRAFDALIQPFDALIVASTMDEAPLITQTEPDDSSLIWSLVGAPAVSVPQIESSKMPLAIQLVGRRRGDRRLLQLVAHLASTNLIGELPPIDPHD